MGPWPMRGLRGGCHGNVRICGKLVASGGRSISHIPALIEGASVVNPVISSLRRIVSTITKVYWQLYVTLPLLRVTQSLVKGCSLQCNICD